MKDTTIPPYLLTIIRDYGHNKAVAWLDGEDELAKPDDDLCSFLARHDVEFDQLMTADQDQLRDEYIESVKTTMASRVSSPVTVEVPFGKPGGPSATRESLDRVGADVPPLGEIQNNGDLSFYDDSGHELYLIPCTGKIVIVSEMGSNLRKSEVQSLIAHLSTWLSTGSFSLTPPVSTQIDSGASLTADRDFTPPSPEKPVVQPTESDSTGLLEECRDTITALVSHIEMQTCSHEDTHRGGSIWTICSACGMKWADDEGGMPDSFPSPTVVLKAESLLKKLNA
jgi:hypothetical protein